MNNVKERTSPLTAVVMIPLALIVGLPLYYIVVNTFKTQAEMSSSPFALPTQLFLDNYATVFGTVPLVQSFANTLFVTVASLLLMLIIGSMAAYGMIIGQHEIQPLVRCRPRPRVHHPQPVDADPAVPAARRRSG